MTDQPTTKNYLPQNRFVFDLPRLPNFKYFAQGLSFPAVSAPGIKYPTPLGSLNLPPNKFLFGDLTLKFAVNEDMSSYTEILDWMTGLGRPEDFTGYADLAANGPMSGNGVQSSATLTLLSNQGVPRIMFSFQNVEPVALGGFELSFDSNSQEVVKSSVTFKYRDFDYTRDL